MYYITNKRSSDERLASGFTWNLGRNKEVKKISNTPRLTKTTYEKKFNENEDISQIYFL